MLNENERPLSMGITRLYLVHLVQNTRRCANTVNFLLNGSHPTVLPVPSLPLSLQGPGDLIYLPHDVVHAVLNLDENVAVTENFMTVNSIDDLAVHKGTQSNPFL